MIESGVAAVAVYAALNGLLILVLAYVVGHQRGLQNALEPGAMGDKRLTRAIRAHGNATEYVPTALILLLILALLSTPVAMLHVLGAAFTIGRHAQASGMMLESHPNAVRFTGNLLTGLVYLVASCTLLYRAML
jgi:uncharacterized membrane protein YecN with MAPEG domain